MSAEDGRRLRRERNRDAVVQAVLELVREGELAPGVEAVAARAGLSARSVFRYFDDLDDLCRAAIARQLALVGPILGRELPHQGHVGRPGDRRRRPAGRACSRRWGPSARSPGCGPRSNR